MIISIAFLLIVTRIVAQNLEVTPILTTNGYAVVKTHEKLVVENYTKILHIINTTQYTSALGTIYENLNMLKLDRTDGNYKLLQSEIETLKRSIKSLTPKFYNDRRTRRGLINVLGKGMKFITGTMDSEDSEEISRHLEVLNTNDKRAIEQLNKQVVINDNLFREITQIENSINSQRANLSIFLAEIVGEANKMVPVAQKSQFILQLYADISALNRHADKIEDIILLSRLGVLAHDVFTDEEIVNYNIGIEIMPFIKNSIILRDNLIILVVLVPNFTVDKYFNAIIIPSPNDKKEELNFGIQNVIMKKNEIFEYNEETILKKKLKYHSNECIKKILTENNVCNYITNEHESIIAINEETIVTKNLQKTKITQNCNNEETIIRGNNFIKYSNCKLIIKNSIFENNLKQFRETIILPTLNINMTKIINNLTLENIHVNTQKNRDLITYLEFKSKTENISLSVILILCLIIIIIALYFNLCQKNKIVKSKEKKSNDHEMIEQGKNNLEINEIMASDPFQLA